MDLSNPLSALTSRLEAGVLLALTRPGWASGLQIYRATRELAGTGSDTGVRKVLARLCEQGLVESVSHPPATLYRLNADHLIYPYVLAVTGLRAELIDRIKTTISAWQVPPRHVSLFGSFARGEAGPSSDIDILAVPPRITPHQQGWSDQWQAQLTELSSSIARWTGNPAQILDLDQDTLAVMLADEAPIVQSWRADQIRLAGTDLMTMLREIRTQATLPSRPT